MRVAFDLGLAWSDEHGLRLVGSGGFEVTLPVQLSLGEMLVVQAIHIAFTAGAGGGTATVAATVALKLGPIGATVEKMGFALHLAPAPDGGNLGTFALSAGFRPPTGVGLSINLPAVSGGGFLGFDAEAGRYAGVFELTLVDTVSVKAIGIITTKLPDGSPGFALLLLITAEGFTPIQLGMGFALTGHRRPASR